AGSLGALGRGADLTGINGGLRVGVVGAGIVRGSDCLSAIHLAGVRVVAAGVFADVAIVTWSSIVLGAGILVAAVGILAHVARAFLARRLRADRAAIGEVRVAAPHTAERVDGFGLGARVALLVEEGIRAGIPAADWPAIVAAVEALAGRT